MEITITEKKEKPLLKLVELEARVTFTGATPSRKDVVAAVAKAAKAKHELVIVKRISNRYGEQSAHVRAYVYHDRKALEKLEHASSLKKHAVEKEEAAEEAPAPEKEEAPKEEVKEEKPAEKKEEEAEEKPAPKKEEPAPKEEPKKEEPKAEDKKEEKKPEEEKKGDS